MKQGAAMSDSDKKRKLINTSRTFAKVAESVGDADPKFANTYIDKARKQLDLIKKLGLEKVVPRASLHAVPDKVTTTLGKLAASRGAGMATKLGARAIPVVGAGLSFMDAAEASEVGAGSDRIPDEVAARSHEEIQALLDELGAPKGKEYEDGGLPAMLSPAGDDTISSFQRGQERVQPNVRELEELLRYKQELENPISEPQAAIEPTKEPEVEESKDEPMSDGTKAKAADFLTQIGQSLAQYGATVGTAKAGMAGGVALKTPDLGFKKPDIYKTHLAKKAAERKLLAAKLKEEKAHALKVIDSKRKTAKDKVTEEYNKGKHNLEKDKFEDKQSTTKKAQAFKETESKKQQTQFDKKLGQQRDIAGGKLDLDKDKFGLKGEIDRGKLEVSKDKLALDRETKKSKMDLDRDNYDLKKLLGLDKNAIARENITLKEKLGVGGLKLKAKISKDKNIIARENMELKKLLSKNKNDIARENLDLKEKLGMGKLDLSKDKFGHKKEFDEKVFGLKEKKFGLEEEKFDFKKSSYETDNEFKERQLKWKQKEAEMKLKTNNALKRVPNRITPTGDIAFTDKAGKTFITVNGELTEINSNILINEKEINKQKRFVETQNRVKTEHAQLSDKQVDKLGDLIASYRSANDIKGMRALNSVGPVEGRLKKAWTDMGFKGNPDFVKLKTEVGTLLASYMKSISGVAISEPEAQRLEKLIPSLKEDKANFLAKLDVFQKQLVRSIESQVDIISIGQPLRAETARNVFQKGVGDYLDQSRKEKKEALKTIMKSKGKISIPKESPKEIKQLHDGKWAVFNSETREFLRWEE